MHRVVLLSLLLLMAWLAPPRQADAQVRHCQTADGTRLYTDRPCADLGAREARDPPTGQATGNRLQACARSVPDLAYALDDAIRSGDANRIAGLYDWAGMGSSNANRVLDQLQRIAERPLVDVREARAGDEGSGSGVGPIFGLRVEQVLSDGYTPSRATFGLRRRLGCWWVHL